MPVERTPEYCGQIAAAMRNLNEEVRGALISEGVNVIDARREFAERFAKANSARVYKRGW